MRISVDQDTMGSSASDFQRLAREIDDTIAQLNQNAQQVTYSWSGSSQSSFSSLWQRLHSSLAELSTALGQVGNRLNAANAHYSDTDHSIIRSQ